MLCTNSFFIELCGYTCEKTADVVHKLNFLGLTKAQFKINPFQNWQFGHEKSQTGENATTIRTRLIQFDRFMHVSYTFLKFSVGMNSRES